MSSITYEITELGLRNTILYIYLRFERCRMKIPINIHRYIFFRNSISVLAIIFAITTFVLIIVGFIYHDMKKEKTINDQFEYLTAISNFKTSQINDWLNQRYGQLELIRANTPLISNLEVLSTSPNKLTELRKWFDALQTLYQYDDIILVDPSSKIIYHNKPSTFQIGDKDSLLCKNCEISDSILFSDSDEENETAENLKFYVPLSSVRKQTKIVLILSVKPEKIFNVILNLNIAKSSTMESILVKPFKEGIVYLNTPKFFSVEEKLDSNRKALMEANVIKSRKGFFVEGIDYKNDKVIALYQGVTSTTWTLITKINRSEFYAPANELAKLVILSIISIDLFFFIILFFIYRKSILTNYKKMYAAEVEKSRLENRFESLVKGVKDIAIFILDQEGKIISWNQGAGIIEGYSSEEILGKHFSIFYSEDEINKKKPVNNLNVAVQTGSYQEEGWRLKKDGSLYWANVLITALQDNGGNVYGFLKIIRDLTQSKKNEEEIKNSRDFYLKLLNGFPNPVWISGLELF